MEKSIIHQTTPHKLNNLDLSIFHNAKQQKIDSLMGEESFIQEPTMQKIKPTCMAGGFFFVITRLIREDSNQTNGGVRGGTIRLLPVDSKAEAKRSSLLSS